jgi:transglutaminase-like putative cysteine protease
MRYRVTHVTRYEYESKVSHAHHLAHLCPRASELQHVDACEIRVEPTPAARHTEIDYFGNRTERIEIREPHRELQVTCVSEVRVLPRRAEVPSVPWNELVGALDAQGDPVALEYRCDSPHVRIHPRLRVYAEPSFEKGRDLMAAVVELNQRIFSDFKYDTMATNVSTPLRQVLRERRGVCQDFAHLAVGCLRSLGLPARYVSGYLETRPPEGKPRLVGADASHAWASVFLPDGRWLDFDPTNGVLPDGRHVTVAWGRDFSDVSPLRGVVLGGGFHRVHVGVDTLALDE